jgi:hypothetical protein
LLACVSGQMFIFKALLMCALWPIVGILINTACLYVRNLYDPNRIKDE